MRRAKLFAIFLVIGSIWTAVPASAAPPRDTGADTWVGADALGRALPGFKECGAPRAGKFVGIFYFLWMQPGQRHLYDISKLLAADPLHPKWGPAGAFHWWSQPALGYYTSDDEFVIRRHARMLSDAGIDVVIFDVTNALTYDATLHKVCDVFTQIRREGGRTPQFAFIAHSGSDRVIAHLYETLYSKGLYSPLWFRWKGKPLILASQAGVEPAARAFFTFRESWAWTKGQKWFGDGRDKWPWLDHTPQQPGWHDGPGKPEEICVCVAEHPVSNIGRSFHAGHEPSPGERHPERGQYFAEQWKRALEVDPQFIFVTGWNEWIAQRFVSKDGSMKMAGEAVGPGGTFFVDTYSQEFSRDIEPMRGGHGDDFYYQLVANVRRFKGVRPNSPLSPAKTIAIDGDFHQWDSVRPEYLDDLFDTAHRNHPGYGGAGPYKNDTGRNDFDTIKVSYDAANVYFYVRTREPISAPAGENWMNLLIDADRNHATGWEGYDFLINRARPGEGTCGIERNAGGWKWENAGAAHYAVRGNEMHLAVPRSALGLGAGVPRFDFKWADNVPPTGNIADFIDKGDVAPNGRFNYRFGP
ncbi:MAG TPA: hypothetical protein VFC78_00600 [Tepidisphaeraceae bacterium]|nr:hypothetical protein [Tepidisphaeraceae bacterium]